MKQLEGPRPYLTQAEMDAHRLTEANAEQLLGDKKMDNILEYCRPIQSWSNDRNLGEMYRFQYWLGPSGDDYILYTWDDRDYDDYDPDTNYDEYTSTSAEAWRDKYTSIWIFSSVSQLVAAINFCFLRDHLENRSYDPVRRALRRAGVRLEDVLTGKATVPARYLGPGQDSERYIRLLTNGKWPTFPPVANSG